MEAIIIQINERGIKDCKPFSQPKRDWRVHRAVSRDKHAKWIADREMNEGGNAGQHVSKPDADCTAASFNAPSADAADGLAGVKRPRITTHASRNFNTPRNG